AAVRLGLVHAQQAEPPHLLEDVVQRHQPGLLPRLRVGVHFLLDEVADRPAYLLVLFGQAHAPEPTRTAISLHWRLRPILLQVVLLDLLVQRRRRDAEDLRGPGPVAVLLLERLPDRRALERLEALAAERERIER